MDSFTAFLILIPVSALIWLTYVVWLVDKDLVGVEKNDPRYEEAKDEVLKCSLMSAVLTIFTVMLLTGLYRAFFF